MVVHVILFVKLRSVNIIRMLDIETVSVEDQIILTLFISYTIHEIQLSSITCHIWCYFVSSVEFILQFFKLLGMLTDRIQLLQMIWDLSQILKFELVVVT